MNKESGRKLQKDNRALTVYVAHNPPDTYSHFTDEQLGEISAPAWSCQPVDKLPAGWYFKKAQRYYNIVNKKGWMLTVSRRLTSVR